MQDVNVLQLQTSGSSNKLSGSNGLGKGKGGKRKYTQAATYRVIRRNIMMEISADVDADDDNEDDYDNCTLHILPDPS